VLKGEFHFDYSAFSSVSDECKHLIKCCLVRDFKHRYSASEALAHPWIKNRSDNLHQGTIGDKGVSQEVI
jgi:serine/threonine protein kinase